MFWRQLPLTNKFPGNFRSWPNAIGIHRSGFAWLMTNFGDLRATDESVEERGLSSIGGSQNYDLWDMVVLRVVI